MLIKIDPQHNKLSYHEKILSNIRNTLNFLPKAFWECSPIISGSYAITLLFKPSAIYDDIDFYFTNENDYIKAKNLLDGLEPVKNSTNCLNYINYDKNVKYQLVNSTFLPPEELIYTHDFKNVSIAIQNETIYLDNELYHLYNDGLLSIRTTQLKKTMTLNQKLIKIANLINRVAKYTSRYDLTIDNPSKEILKSLQSFMKAVPLEKKRKVIVSTSIYYNGTFNPTQNNMHSIHEIETYLNNILKSPDSNNLETLPF